MATTVDETPIWRLSEVEDPEYEEREWYIVEGLLKANPRLRQRLFEKGRLDQARATLRRVLERRQLTLSQDDEARIEACAELATLERWHDQAITAASAFEALR